MRVIFSIFYSKFFNSCLNFLFIFTTINLASIFEGVKLIDGCPHIITSDDLHAALLGIKILSASKKLLLCKPLCFEGIAAQLSATCEVIVDFKILVSDYSEELIPLIQKQLNCLCERGRDICLETLRALSLQVENPAPG